MKPRSNPSPEPTDPPGLDYDAILEGISQMSEVFGGQLAAMKAQGFDHREAATIVVSIAVSNAAGAWKDVLAMWGLRVPEEGDQ